ncbi:MAG: hypothetical protein AAFX08_10900 [Pseudomonadota bacterium]
MRRFVASLFVAWAATAFGVAAEEAPYTNRSEDMARLGELAGGWRGALAYRDYGTGEREEIGMAALIAATPDDEFIVTQARYTDPGFDVFILTVATFDAASGDYLESYHRDGSIERFVYPRKSMRVLEDGWEYVFEGDGRDDDRPASIRRTFSLNGDRFVQRKDVDFLDDDAGSFEFRNETVLLRSQGEVSFDGFRAKN